MGIIFGWVRVGGSVLGMGGARMGETGATPFEPPRGGGFEPVLTEGSDVQRSEDICYGVQCSLLLWTNRQNDAGTRRGHAGLENVLQKANEEVETAYPQPPEFIAQGDRVMVVGVATGRIKATKKTFEDHWVFDITVRHGKVTRIREYLDTQALARASETDASEGD